VVHSGALLPALDVHGCYSTTIFGEGLPVSGAGVAEQAGLAPG
jgi:hypothetical protein